LPVFPDILQHQLQLGDAEGYFQSQILTKDILSDFDIYAVQIANSILLSVQGFAVVTLSRKSRKISPTPLSDQDYDG
jgi:hypothetical protein